MEITPETIPIRFHLRLGEDRFDPLLPVAEETLQPAEPLGQGLLALLLERGEPPLVLLPEAARLLLLATRDLTMGR